MREQLIVLGTRIKKIRKERKMTLQALADRTGLTAGCCRKSKISGRFLRFRSWSASPPLCRSTLRRFSKG